MSSPFRERLRAFFASGLDVFVYALVPALALIVVAARSAASHPQPAGSSPRSLRVCAEPANLPFSSMDGAGFENRIAELVAAELHRPLEYRWHAQRRAFVRTILKAGECDLVMGEPSSFEPVLATRPYYRSSYVFVTRRDGGPAIHSLDDPRLRRLRVGVPVVGDDGAGTPPAHALARRGIVSNVVGFAVIPAGRIVDAVARGDVDVAIAWGPTAGYYARRVGVPLTLEPVSPRIDVPFMPFVFDISMGVRRGDTTFRAALDSVIARRRAGIDSILDAYGVPRVR